MPEVRGCHHCHQVGVHHLLNIPTQSVVSDSAVMMTRLTYLTVTASGIAMLDNVVTVSRAQDSDADCNNASDPSRLVEQISPEHGCQR